MANAYGFDSDDITIGGDPDNWDSPGGGLSEEEAERELQSIERLAGIAFNSPHTDGVSRATPIASDRIGTSGPARKRTNYERANQPRRRRQDGVAGTGNGSVPNPRRSDAPGTSGSGTGSSELSEEVGPGTDAGSISGRSGRVVPKRIRRKGIDSLRELPPRDATGINVAKGYKRPEFERAQFNASLKDLKFTTTGDVEMRILIPYEDRLEAVKFGDAFGVEFQVLATRRTYDDPK